MQNGSVELNTDELPEDLRRIISGGKNKVRDYLRTCEYKCNRGKVYLAGQGLYEDCPHCSPIYKSIAEGDMTDDDGRDIYKILSIPSRYRHTVCVIDDIFPKSTRSKISNESAENIISYLKDIYNYVTRGELLQCSYLFYLGEKVDILPYIFDTLRQAYKSGLKVLPYVNAMELIQLWKVDEEPVLTGYKPGDDLKKELNVSFMDYTSADVVITSIPTVAGKSSINMIQTLINMRRKRGLNTVVFSETAGTSRDLGYVINEDEKLITAFIEGIKQEDRPKKQYNSGYYSNDYQAKRKEVLERDNKSNINYGIADENYSESKGFIQHNFYQQGQSSKTYGVVDDDYELSTLDKL